MIFPKKFIPVAVAALVLGSTFASGQSGREYRRVGIHNGNQVRTVFNNWGVIGQPGENGPRGAWKNDNDGYLGDVSPFVGVEARWKDTSFHSVVTCPVSRPALNQDVNPVNGQPWTFEPVGGYLNANQDKIAMSTNRLSWPPYWPDKLTDPTDPGWSGSWNGYFGKRINADQESYFLMDDNNDQRFSDSLNNPRRIAFRPDSANPARNGLGLVVSVRGMQWAQFLAKDNIFWLYEIHNTGTADYNRVVFGMIVGTYVGVTSIEDYHEYDDDWSFYDASQNITYTGDFGRDVSRNPRWVGSVGMVGYAFLESPGNPFDGIDNDGDADSSLVGRSAPKFTSTSFDSTELGVLSGQRRTIVLIDTNYNRSLYTIPDVDSVLLHSRGLYQWIYPRTHRSKVAEGNVLRTVIGNEYVNPNSYDGVDNDFDGLIDENFYLHFRQLKRTNTTPPKVLIDILRPVRYKDFAGGPGTDPRSMVDEARNDRIDNNGDWAEQFDDVGRDGIPLTGDFGEADGAPTSGYDDLGNDTQLPGEPHVDKTDVRESDQIGLTSFFYFSPAGKVTLGEDETLWKNLAPGYFDVPPSIVNNRPESGEDGDFIYGSGYFPLRAKSTERFSLALVYGGGKGGSVDDDIADLLKNKKTVQKIYDANYQFPQPPDKPTLVAVPGDHQVTLYWDRKAEETIDPVLRTKDFEGYKVYRSTDPDFSDIFTITDATGSPQGYRPLVQYDIKDGVIGYFRPNAELFEAAAGYSFYMGSDNGIQHTFVDRDVRNGQRYFYALVAYDKGDELIGIFPGENTKFISILSSGEIIHDQNTAVVVPNAKTAGYVQPASGVELSHLQTRGTGKVYYEVIDQTKLNGHRYQVEFQDTQIDSIDNNNNGISDAADSTEWIRSTSSYSVRDLEDVTEEFMSLDTGLVHLGHDNLIASTVVVKDFTGNIVPPGNYLLNGRLGEIRGSSAGSLPSGKYLITFQYYPVYRSDHMQGSPFIVENKDADIFDGLALNFHNDWSIDKIESSSGWVGPIAYIYSFAPLEIQSAVTGDTIKGYKSPNDYEIQFYDHIVDTSAFDADLFADPIPVNFRVYNVTDGVYIKFAFFESDPVPGSTGRLSPGDDIAFLERNPRGGLSRSWDMFFTNKPTDPPDTVYNLTTGDKLVLNTTKPFRNGDVFEFSVEPPQVSVANARDELSQVKAVPNPYITTSSFELPLNPGITSGRGTRKIDFIHLPAGASVQIFTSRGEHVVTLYHDANIEDGSVSWNLKTEENLDVAYGVYFYVVDSPVGKKTGKLAIIK